VGCSLQARSDSQQLCKRYVFFVLLPTKLNKWRVMYDRRSAL
jgi:hypothetical protein